MGTNLVMIHGIPGPDRMSGSGRTPVGSLSPVLPPDLQRWLPELRIAAAKLVPGSGHS